TPYELGRFDRMGSIDPAAYDAYLRGRFFWNQRTRESLLRSIDCFQSAIAMAPTFASAHAAMAQSWGPLGYLGFRGTDSATAALGYALFLAGHEEEAVARLHGALELDPQWFFARRDLALVDVARGRLDEAIEAFRAIDEHGSLGHALARAGRTADARDVLASL